MKITDLKCAVIGSNPVVRITTDAGIDGYGQAENSKRYLKPHIMFYRDRIIGQDPRDVERVMTRIRRLGAFKPWGAAVSSIEMALWDIAGQAAGVPVYRLLGGAFRDRIPAYASGLFMRDRPDNTGALADEARAYADAGFPAVKMKIGLPNPKEDYTRVGAVRKALGDDIDAPIIQFQIDGDGNFQSIGIRVFGAIDLRILGRWRSS